MATQLLDSSIDMGMEQSIDKYIDFPFPCEKT
jgi:hypothetical protein